MNTSCDTGELIIHIGNYTRFLAAPPGQGFGLIPRDYKAHPRGSYGAIQAVDFPLIPRSEWDQRIRDKIAQKAQLSDIVQAQNVPILDQNGRGYCWAHSATGCVMAARAVANQPTVGLSAYAVACVIKNYRDEGGWGAQAAEFIAGRGVPSEEFWPQRSVDRANDNANTWADAAKYKIVGQWADMTQAQYDRTLSFDQFGTLWLSNEPTVNDYNWWTHSVYGCDLTSAAQYKDKMRDEGSGKLITAEAFDLIWYSDEVTAGYGSRIRNSWGQWGQNGFSVLAGSKAAPDGGVGIMAVVVG